MEELDFLKTRSLAAYNIDENIFRLMMFGSNLNRIRRILTIDILNLTSDIVHNMRAGFKQ